MSSPDHRPTPHDPGLRAMALPITCVVATALALVLLPLTEPPTTGVPMAVLFLMMIEVQRSGLPAVTCAPCTGSVFPGAAAGGAVGGGFHDARGQ